MQQLARRLGVYPIEKQVNLSLVLGDGLVAASDDDGAAVSSANQSRPFCASNTYTSSGTGRSATPLAACRWVATNVSRSSA